MPDPSPTMLAYRDSIEREEISIELKDGCVRVFTPPLRNWKQLGWFRRMIWILGIATGLFFLLAVDDAVRRREFFTFIPFGEFAATLIILTAVAWYRVRQSFFFEVSRDQLRILKRAGRTTVSETLYRRDIVGSVHVNPFNGKLVIPITKQDTMELFISDQKTDVKRVADAIDVALRAEPSAVDRSLPEIIDQLRAIAPPRNRTIALAVIAIVAACAGVGLGIEVNWGLGFWVFMFGMMSCGIVLGTQEKKFWA